VADCEDCGSTVKNKNAAGHYRDCCRACIQDRAERTRHVESCSDDDCRICRDYTES